MGTHNQSCSSFLEGPNPMKSLAFMLILVGGTLLAVFSSTIIPPYSYDRAFRQTTCVVQQGYLSGNVCCQATVSSISGCSESYVYPCAKVKVNYTVDGVSHNATLYDDYYSATYVTLIDKCSHFQCFSQSYEGRATDANDFISSYGTPTSESTCYYNPDDVTTVLIKVTSEATVINALLWPSLITTCGLVLLICLCLRDRKGTAIPQHENHKGEKEEMARQNTVLSYTSNKAENDDDESTDIGMRKASSDTLLVGTQSASRPTTRAGINLDLENELAQNGGPIPLERNCSTHIVLVTA